MKMRTLTIVVAAATLLSGCAGFDQFKPVATPDFCQVRNGHRSITLQQQEECIRALSSVPGEMFHPMNWGRSSNAPLLVESRR